MFLVLLRLASPAVAAELRLPDSLPPQLLQGLDLPSDVQSIALGAGAAVAFAVPRERHGRIGSTVEIRDERIERTRIDLDLRVRDLIWLSDGRLLGIGFRAARRTQGEAFLLVWDPARDRFKRLMRLPPTARDLAYGNRPDLLMLTARDELRTIRLPLLRSGPLFRVLGDNRSVAVLQGSHVLIGQSQALLLVDLNDRQSREQMPVRERVAVDSPIEQLSAAIDGNGALAGMLDGSVQRVLLDPLRLTDDGEGQLVSAFLASSSDAQRRAASSTPDPAKLTTPRPPDPGTPELQVAPPSAEEQPPVEREPTTPVEEPVALEKAQTEPKQAQPPAPAPRPAPATPQPSPVTTSDPGVEEEPARVEATPPTDKDAPIHGRLSGPGSSAVIAVVAFGPDSVLREAARIIPSEDGTFNFDTLPAGRYRIQLDGGGGKVLVSDPAVHIVDLKVDSRLSIEFRVLQAL